MIIIDIIIDKPSQIYSSAMHPEMFANWKMNPILKKSSNDYLN